ncbi:hypothetical protein BCT52_03970 [Vibrio breoganii]|nr:hypothetical protein BCT52_03970 [Vibrio breoganii]
MIFIRTNSNRMNIEAISIGEMVILFTLSMLTIYNIFNMSYLDFYRHDSGYYIDNYGYKFITEGRWLNYLTFNISRSLPPIVNISIFFISSFCFFYLVSKSLDKDIKTSFLFALLCINSPPMYSLLLWPVTPSLSYLTLIILYLCHQNKMATNEILFLSGILSFGTYSNLHFLTPIIFFKYLVNTSYKNNVIFFIVWVVTFILGYAFVNLLVYIVTYFNLDSATAINLSEWRNPNIVHNWIDLAINIRSISLTIISDITNGFLLYPLIIMICIIPFIKPNAVHIIWAILIFFSIYASCLYHGIMIEYRSITSSFIAVFLILLLSSKPFCKISIIICCLILIYGNYNKIKWYSSRTSEVVSLFKDVEHQMNAPKERVVVYFNDEESSKFHLSNEGIPYRFQNINHVKIQQLMPYLKSKGFKQIDFKDTEVIFTGEIRFENYDDASHIYFE